MGLGGFVWEGSSSPWGLEWGVCFFGRTGFLIGLCSGCGSGRETGWCRASSSWRSRSWPGPAFTRGDASRLSLGVDCRGDIVSDLCRRYKNEMERILLLTSGPDCYPEKEDTHTRHRCTFQSNGSSTDVTIGGVTKHSMAAATARSTRITTNTRYTWLKMNRAISPGCSADF